METDTQKILAIAATRAAGMTCAEALEGIAEVTGMEIPPVVPSSHWPALKLRAAGWEPSRVYVAGGVVWNRGNERCVLGYDGTVRPLG